MNVGVLRAALLVVLALGLTACGTQQPTGNVRQGPAESAAFTVRAGQVVAQWKVSPAARTWRSVLVLLGPGELTSIPRDAGAGAARPDPLG